MATTRLNTCDVITVASESAPRPASFLDQERYPRFEIPLLPIHPSPTQWNDVNESILDALLASLEGFTLVTELQDGSAVAVVDSIHQMLESGRLDEHQQRNYTAVLRKLCGNCGILPTSYMITDSLKIVGELAIAGGGFAEVWEGTHRGRRVAMKVLKVYLMSDQESLKKRFCKEAIIWRRLSHPNVLPFIGIATVPFKFCMVSPWMANGDVNAYSKSHPRANLIRILRDIIDGLYYLHSMNIVHGDLKGPNILMNDNGQPCLADFGLTKIICDTLPGYSITTANEGTARWMAPELIMPELFGLTKCVSSKESDIYAFGMVVCEVVTKAIPFSEYRTISVVPKVLEGIRPKPPVNAATANLVKAVWPLAEECWHQDWNERPCSFQVLDQLNLALLHWNQSESLPVTASSTI